jgi:hypothetical protein
LATFTTKNTIAGGLRAAVVIKDFVVKALEAHRVVKLDRASNTGLLRRCVVFLRLMLLVVEILLIILRSMGTGHSVALICSLIFFVTRVVVQGCREHQNFPRQVLIKYTTKMVRNRISNDIDLMRPTQYIVPKNQVAKKPLSEPEPLPPFSPLSFKTLFFYFYIRCIRGCSVATPHPIWRLHIVTEMELKSEYEAVVR